MKQSLKTGLSFGLTSGIVATLGIMVGLNSITSSRIAVIGGVLTVAIADSFSDALSIHISEETDTNHSSQYVRESTVTTFVSKFLFALTFLIPLLFLELTLAVIASVLWGLVSISFLSYYIAKQKKEKPLRMITEHVLFTIMVVAVTHFVGVGISSIFG